MKQTYKRGESISQLAQCLADSVARNLIAQTMIGASGQSSDQKRIFVAPAKCYIRKIYFITETADEVGATNYWDIKIVNVTDSEDLSSAVVSTNTGGTAIVADTPLEITVDQNNQLDALDVLELDLVAGGTPIDLQECSVVVVYSFDEDDEA